MALGHMVSAQAAEVLEAKVSQHDQVPVKTLDTEASSSGSIAHCLSTTGRWHSLCFHPRGRGKPHSQGPGGGGALPWLRNLDPSRDQAPWSELSTFLNLTVGCTQFSLTVQP
jgi:hypothetical protein